MAEKTTYYLENEGQRKLALVALDKFITNKDIIKIDVWLHFKKKTYTPKGG